jgi:nucleoside-diphosphate-sugar epimerase
MWHAGVVSRDSELTVAVTGPTGTFGFGLIPLLQAEDRVARIVGIARRPFDPAAYGWTKLEYRRGDVLFYAQEKAELEHLLQAEATNAAGPALYLLRPPIVLGPHAVGAKDLLPGPLAPLGRILASRIGRSPVPLPALVPTLPLQFVHEDDLGQALLRCVLGAGAPGAYNIAADGILSTADVAREFGLIPLPLPAGPAQLAARAVAALPFLPPAAQWVEAASHPAIMDTTKAKQDLGWAPRFTALEALRDTLRPRPAGR